jgi:replicative DNA helicase
MIQIEKTTLVDLQKGKLPPQAIDLEEAILGAMMIDKNGLFEAIDALTADVFYKDAHKHIFEAISSLFSKNNPVDLVTVSAELKRVSKLELAGGDFYLIQLTQKISSSAHIDYHSKLVIQKFVQRLLIRVSSELIEKSYDESCDIFEILETAYSELGKVTDLITVGKVHNFQNSVLDFITAPKATKKGVPSSILKLSKHLNGYQNSDLIILAARPGMGKTAMVLNELLECGLNGIPAAFFSLEMSTSQIIGRLISIISGIDISKINHHNLTNSESKYVKECALMLSKLPIYIDDTGGISPVELKIKANKLKRDHGIKKIFIDYLQLMKVKNKKINSRENEISEISQSLKNIAKDLDVPVTALSQLSRAVEQRGASKRPLLSDLRDSGSIEQDADIVMFIYRPEYYKIEEWDDEERGSTYNQAEIEIAKYRHGQPGVLRVGCDLRYMRFMDIENLGTDLTGKYFRDIPAPPKPENLSAEEKPLPKITPAGAFCDQQKHDFPDWPGDPENEDVPF